MVTSYFLAKSFSELKERQGGYILAYKSRYGSDWENTFEGNCLPLKYQAYQDGYCAGWSSLEKHISSLPIHKSLWLVIKIWFFGFNNRKINETTSSLL